MISLEGSGFTICLGVILLLTGIVMYYCKSKITACENKMNTMLNLISELHSEVNTLKQTNVSVPNLTETTHFGQPLQQENESDESDSEEDEESESENNNSLKATINPFETHPYKELIPSSTTIGSEVINESSAEEDDTEDEETSKEQVKVVDLGQIEELEIEDLNDEDEEDEESSEEEPQIDYGKMQVAALKKLASERNLASNVNKLRKQELVNLLQGQ